MTRLLVAACMAAALGLAGCCVTPDVRDTTPPEVEFTVIMPDGTQTQFGTDRDPPFLRGRTFDLRRGEWARVNCWAKDPSALLRMQTSGSGLVWRPYRLAPGGTDTMRDQWRWEAGDCPHDVVLFQAEVTVEDTLDNGRAGMFAENFGGADGSDRAWVTAPAVPVTFRAIDD